jgi:hypothetical protein
MRGSLHIEHTLARVGAERLWKMLNEGGDSYVHALGALTGEGRGLCFWGLLFASCLFGGRRGGGFGAARRGEARRGEVGRARRAGAERPQLRRPSRPTPPPPKPPPRRQPGRAAGCGRAARHLPVWLAGGRRRQHGAADLPRPGAPPFRLFCLLSNAPYYVACARGRRVRARRPRALCRPPRPSACWAAPGAAATTP